MKHLTILASLLALTACGSSQSSTSSAGGEPAGAEPVAAAATGTPPGYDTAWTEMKYDQKKEVMKKVVMPKMGELFASFSGDFGDADCTLCHGEAANTGDFEMPNPDLPPLAFGSPEWPEFEASHAEVLAFMEEQVTPQMAQLLGVEPYTPENPTGFGCFSCHPQPNAM
jgi:hypothetical protein